MRTRLAFYSSESPDHVIHRYESVQKSFVLSEPSCNLDRYIRATDDRPSRLAILHDHSSTNQVYSVERQNMILSLRIRYISRPYSVQLSCFLQIHIKTNSIFVAERKVHNIRSTPTFNALCPGLNCSRHVPQNGKVCRSNDTLFSTIPFFIISLFISFLYTLLVSSCFHFLCFILGFYSLELFILAYREYMSAGNAKIYLPTPQRTITRIIRLHCNAPLQVLLSDTAINCCWQKQ